MVIKQKQQFSVFNSRNLFSTVPPSENASLVFFTQTDMRRVDSNGELQDHFVSGEVSAIEIWHRNRTVCAMYSSAWTTVSMRCHRIDDLNANWLMPLPEMVGSMHCKYHLHGSHQPTLILIFYLYAAIDKLLLDWISGNWYFLNNERSVVFMCTNSMQYCNLLLEDVLNPSSLVLDPTKG